MAGILANTEDVEGRAVKTTVGELLPAEFTNISEDLHEEFDTLENDAEKPQNSPNGATIRLHHGQKLPRDPVRTNNIPALVHHNNAYCQYHIAKQEWVLGMKAE